MKLIAMDLHADLEVSRRHKIVLRFPPEKFRILFLLLIWIGLQNQIVFPQGAIKSSISYVTETKVIYRISDSLHVFSIAEKVKLLPEITRDSIVRLVYTNNDLKTTIHHLDNNQFEDWMSRPVKTIIDKSRIKVYDRFGNLMLNKTHSVMYKSNYNGLKNYLTTNSLDVVPDFIQLTATLKQEMLDSGFVYSNLGDGYLKFVKDSLELIFNNNKRSNELRMYFADGTLNYSIKKGYKLNPEGKVVPSYSMEKKWDDRFPGNCVQQYKIVEYPVYTITNYGPGKWEDGVWVGEGDHRVILFPNPAHNSIKVILPAMADGLNINIFDNTGHLIFENVIISDVTEFNVDISSFERGMYVIVMFNDAVDYSESFVKN